MTNQIINSNEEYNTNLMVFSQPVQGQTKSDGPKFSYYRIPIKTMIEDKLCDLILESPDLFSFGVQENLNSNGDVTGYTMPLCMYDMKQPSQEQLSFYQTLVDIVEKCKEHVVEIKNEVEQYELTKRDLDKSKSGMNLFYHKKIDGKPDPNSSPILYPKLIFSTKTNQFLTRFYDSDSEDQLYVLDHLNKRMTVKCALKVESIFIGSKISVQIKLIEALPTLIQTDFKRMLRRTVEFSEDDEEE